MEAESAQDESPRVLVADDEPVIRDILSDFLTMEGFVVRTVKDGEAALKELQRHPYDLMITDLKMPVMDGLELLTRLNEQQIQVTTVFMTGFGTVETAVEALKRGAYDYILKPFKVEEVVRLVQRALDRRRLEQQNLQLKHTLSLYKLTEAIGSTLALDAILDLIIDTTFREVDADVVTLHLEDPARGVFEERSRRVAPHLGAHAGEDLDFAALFDCYRRDEPVLVHGARAEKFFSTHAAANRRVSFCSIPLKIRHRVIGMLNAYSHTRGKKFSEGQRKTLAVLGSRAAVSIDNARLFENLSAANQDLERANLSLEENFRQTIQGFAHALEENDRYSRGHSDRVSQYARLIGEGLTLGERQVEIVVQSALMHDIGKIGIRYEKLNKPGKLTPEEMAMFRTHPAKGRRILEPIPFLRELIPGCYCHHEAWDGSGYPQGLMNHHIPELGRIIAVADTYDAMTSDRAYRKALPHQVACDELERCCETQFDPEIVKVFLHEIERHRKQVTEAGGEVPR